jgi:hypothetical protein
LPFAPGKRQDPVLDYSFGDTALDRWFADRLARNEALAAHYAG